MFVEIITINGINSMANKMTEIYVSTDVEANGPIPGPYSMLSIGSAAFNDHGELISTFYATLNTLEGAGENPDTMNWWKTQPEAWVAARKDTQPPELVMNNYVQWVKDLPGKPVFVGYPTGFDFTFTYWYMIKFAGESPFSFSAIDIKTMAMTMLKTEFRATTKKKFPKRWFGESKHTHNALDDAIEQGEIFCNMLKELISS
jgi:DNA polymerase III alpha subunit (gram-positive type)